MHGRLLLKDGVGWRRKAGQGRRIVLRLCSAVPSRLRNQEVSSARWVRNPKFCRYLISCRRKADSVAGGSNIYFSLDFWLLARRVAISWGMGPADGTLEIMSSAPGMPTD